MELLNVSRSVLLIIDMQGKLMDVIYRRRMLIDTTIRLLKFAGLFDVPVILTEQYPKGLGPTHPEIRAVFDSLETPKFSMSKTSFGCCGDPEFEALLQAARPGVPPQGRHIVVAGIEAHICVLQTVLELVGQKSHVQVCWDAVSGRGEEHRQHALDRMVRAGAKLTNHESVVFEWMRDKNHPKFREVSALLKEGQPREA